MDILFTPLELLLATARDVLPVLLLLLVFQKFVLKRSIPRLDKVLFGFVLVLAGMTCFLAGLDLALFPIGRTMALQLCEAAAKGGTADWTAYGLIYLFAFLVGFSTSIAEPALIAVAHKAEEASSGAISALGLRITVALGVAVGITVGTFRIVTGTPLFWYVLAGYTVVTIQTFFAPRSIAPLAYDSGGVTTSTVTVPLVAALGLGLASNIPGRSPVLDGFGLIALASLFPIIAVLGYAQIARLLAKTLNRNVRSGKAGSDDNQ